MEDPIQRENRTHVEVAFISDFLNNVEYKENNIKSEKEHSDIR